METRFSWGRRFCGPWRQRSTYIDFNISRHPSTFSHCRTQRHARFDQDRSDVEQRDNAAFLARSLTVFLSEAMRALCSGNAAIRVHHQDDVPALIGELGSNGLDRGGVVGHGCYRFAANGWEANGLGIVAVGGQLGGEGVVEICWGEGARHDDNGWFLGRGGHFVRRQEA